MKEQSQQIDTAPGAVAGGEHYEVKIHPHRCIGAGHCVVAASDVFDQDEESGMVVLLSEQPPASRYAAVKEAARKCPTAAIEIVEK